MMRRLAALCFVLFVSAWTVSADETKPRSFSARTRLYEVTIIVATLPSGENAFEMRITDLATMTSTGSPFIVPG